VADRGDVERVRERIDLQEVVSRYLSLTPSGTGYKGRCPFHKDDTPSFVVNPDKGLWHCFGCGEGGDVFSFLMKIERLSFPEALDRLAAEAGVSIAARATGAHDAEFAALAAADERFRELLRTSPQAERARTTLSGRGLDQPTWDRFGLGYADPLWDGLKGHLSTQFDEALLLRVGLLSQSRGRTYDRFRDRIIFPIYDLADRPIGFGGRAFDASPKYLNSPGSPLFDKGRVLYGLPWAREAMQANRRAILVEGYTDVLSLHQAGLEDAVGSMGTALTQAQADLLGRFAAEVIIAYDRDAAGGAAALRGMGILRNSGLDVRVAVLPEGTDPDSLVRGRGREALEAILEAAVPFHRHFAASLRERFDLTAGHGKEAALDEARAFFRELTSIILRNELVEELHGLFGLTTDALLRDLDPRGRGPARPRRSSPPSHGGDPRDAAQRLLLAVALRGLAPWPAIRERIPPEGFAPPYRGVAAALDSGFDPGAGTAELPDEDAQLISGLTLGELPFDGSDSRLVERAVHDALIRLVDRPAIEDEIRELDVQILAAERDGDTARADDLQRRRRELVAKRRSLGREPKKGAEDAEAQRSRGAGPRPGGAAADAD
jgi:DNA primase